MKLKLNMKTITTIIATLVLLLFANDYSIGQTTDIYTANDTWIVPAGVTQITIEAWGGGGGGGGARAGCASSCEQTATGGGGKGGMYRTDVLNVSPGDNISITVGLGGSGGIFNGGSAAANAGQPGGISLVTLNSTPVVRALGGNGGGGAHLSTTGTGATGYVVGTALPATGYEGGNGSGSCKTTSSQNGGNGGGGAGSGGDGTNAVAPVCPCCSNHQGAVGLGGSGSGGNGGLGALGTSIGQTAGSPASAVGLSGGGGGARAYVNGAQNGAGGGAGARGEVRITYIEACDPQTANAGAAMPAICQGGTTIGLGGSVGGSATTGQWSTPSGGTFSPNANTLNATWTPPPGYSGTATLTLTTTNGCSTHATSNKTVTVNAAAIPTITPSALGFCPGGDVELESSSGASYSWSPTGGTSQTATITTGGNYTVTVTYANGCQRTSNAVNIQAYASPSAPTIGTITQPTCTTPTGSIQLTGLPAGNWTLSAPGGAGTGNSTTIAGLAPNTYSFTVTDANGCISPVSANAVVNPAPATPTAPTIGTITQPTCTTPTGSIQLTGLPAGNWTLSAPGGAGTGASTTIAGLAPNTYSFTVTDANGCISTVSLNAVVNTAPVSPAAPTIGTITQPTCTTPTGSIELTGLPSGNWTLSAPGGAGTGTSTTIAGLAPNTYSFTVTDANGCISTVSANAVVNTAPVSPAAPTIGTITQPTCTTPTGSIELTGLPAGNWTLSAPGGAGTGTSTTITGLAPNTYSFTVTDANGCISTVSANAVVDVAPATPTAPTVGTITQPTCTVSTGSVELSGLPAGSWTINPGNIAGTGATFTVLGLAPDTYTFTVTNADGCESTASLNAVVNPAPASPNAPTIGTITQPTCTTPTGSIELTGLPAGNWTLSAPGGAGTGTSTTITGLAPNTYSFTVTDANGCISTVSANAVVQNITPPTSPVASVTVAPTCDEPTGTIEISSPIGANYSYSVNGGTPQSSAVFAGLTPGDYDFIAIDNSNSCESTVTTVTIIPQGDFPTISVVNTEELVCNGDNDASITIAINGGTAPYDVSWSTPNGVDLEATNLTAGSYTVTVVDANGCQDDQTISITAPQAIGGNFNITNPTCNGSNGSVTVSGQHGESPYSYDWIGQGNTTNTLSGISAGNYSVEITDTNGCQSVVSTTVTSSGDVNVSVWTDNNMLVQGESTLIQTDVTPSSSGVTYQWNPGVGLSCTTCASPVATPSQTTTYTVVVTSAEGCQHTDSITIFVEQLCGDFHIPTMFSPNADGHNDGFCVHGSEGCITSFEIQIFNRWGEMVYQSEDPTECWDGTHKGKILNTAAFVFRLKATTEQGVSVEESGSFNLVR